MENNNLPQEQGLKEYALTDDDMNMYLGVTEVLSQKVVPAVQPQKEPVIPKMNEEKRQQIVQQPAKQEISTDEAQKIKSLTDDYMSSLNDTGYATSSDIQQLTENIPANTNSSNEKLKEYELTDDDLDCYTDALEDGFDKILEKNPNRKANSPKLEETYGMMTEDDYDYGDQPEEEEPIYEEEEEEISPPSKLKSKNPEFKSYMAEDFGDFIAQKYGERNALILDRLFDKQFDLISLCESTEILEWYYDETETVEYKIRNKTTKESFKVMVKFFEKFSNYLKEQEITKRTSEDTIELIKVVEKISDML